MSSGSWSSFAPVKANGKCWEAMVGGSEKAGALRRVHRAPENTVVSTEQLEEGSGRAELPPEGRTPRWWFSPLQSLAS